MIWKLQYINQFYGELEGKFDVRNTSATSAEKEVKFMWRLVNILFALFPKPGTPHKLKLP